MYSKNLWFRRLLKPAAFFIILLSMAAGSSRQAQAASRIFFPDRAYETKNYVYVAIGIDGGGDIYRYKPSTGKKKRLAKGKYNSLNVKGSYIYCGLNDYLGSDATNNYIYRVSTKNGARKKLANGSWPVVVGNWIYYIKENKTTLYGYTVDNGTDGIWRMKLNGKSKQKVSSTSNWVSYLGSDGTSLYYFSAQGSVWQKMNLKTKATETVDLTNYPANLSYKWGLNYAKITYGKTSYSYSGKVIYKTVNGKTKKLTTMKGEVKLLIALGKNLFVVYEKEDSSNGYTLTKYFATVMTNKGKKKKVITSGYEVSGGW